MSRPLAYLITWTTYGSWLPGDSRGWVERREPGIQDADVSRRQEAKELLLSASVILDAGQRRLVEETITGVCAYRGWLLHAVNARSNHVHLVVTTELEPEKVMGQFKAWCSRRLNEQAAVNDRKWWTRHGSTKWINDDSYLQNAIRYVRERQ